MNPNCSSNLNKFRTDNPTARDQLAGTCAGRRKRPDHQRPDCPPPAAIQLSITVRICSMCSLIMEELLPGEALQQLTPLECALCILAAFTHDLGMVMPDEDCEISGSHRHA